MAGLRRTLKKEQRKKLAEAAKKLKITIKSRKDDGSVSVTGGTGLKKTQLYPKGFGRRIRDLHTAKMDTKGLKLQAAVKSAWFHLRTKKAIPVKHRGAWKKAGLKQLKEYIRYMYIYIYIQSLDNP